MNFKEVYTTSSRKETASGEDKEKENKKIEISEESFLNASMISDLIRSIKTMGAKL